MAQAFVAFPVFGSRFHKASEIGVRASSICTSDRRLVFLLFPPSIDIDI